MTPQEIKNTIEASIPNSTAHIFDPANDGQHLQAVVVSPVFEGLPLVKQHQMVLKSLKEGFGASLHALGLKTLTPTQWEEFRSKHNINAS